MSRKFKRFLSILMVVAMVIAMAAACGKKEEEAAEPAEKEETKVEAEKETEPVEDEQAEEQTAEDSNLSKEENGIELEIAIRDTVVNEYFNEKGISKEEFDWPAVGSPAWSYLYELILKYTSEHFIGIDKEVDPNFIPGDSEKELMDVIFNEIVAWSETYGDDNFQFFNDEVIEKLSPYETIIPEIVNSAE